MHKTHIFDQKDNNEFFLPTYLPYFFSYSFRKQTISFLGLYSITDIIILHYARHAMFMALIGISITSMWNGYSVIYFNLHTVNEVNSLSG